MNSLFITTVDRYVSTGQQWRSVRSAVRLLQVQRPYFRISVTWVTRWFPQIRWLTGVSRQTLESGRVGLAPGRTVATYIIAIVCHFPSIELDSPRFPTSRLIQHLPSEGWLVMQRAGIWGRCRITLSESRPGLMSALSYLRTPGLH